MILYTVARISRYTKVCFYSIIALPDSQLAALNKCKHFASFSITKIFIDTHSRNFTKCLSKCFPECIPPSTVTRHAVQGIAVSLITMEIGCAFAGHTIALGFSASLGLYADNVMFIHISFVNRKFCEVSVATSIFSLGGRDGTAYRRGGVHWLDRTSLA